MYSLISMAMALCLSFSPISIWVNQNTLNAAYDYIKENNIDLNEEIKEITMLDDIAKVGEEINSRDLMLGRFSIPSVNVEVACFNSREQIFVDNIDSAAMFGQGDMIIIADHSNQGYSSICDCIEGTKAQFNDGYKIQEYICTASFIGHNTGEMLTDKEYNSIMFDTNKGGITCYTCIGNWQNVWIVFFQPIK